MFYSTQITIPTKPKSIADYKERIHEILHWQIRQTVAIRVFAIKSFLSGEIKTLLDLIALLFFGAIGAALFLITLPFALVSLGACLIEVLWLTITLPLYLIPGIRILPTIVSALLFGAYIAFGIFGMAALTDDFC